MVHGAVGLRSANTLQHERRPSLRSHTMNLRTLFVSALCIGLAACATGGGPGYGSGYGYGPPPSGPSQNVRCYDCGVIERIETVSSEARRVGKVCVSKCRARWSPYHYNKKTDTITLYTS